MTFVQPAFVVLFGIVFTLYWLAPRKSWQNLVLCVSSAIFYGWVHPWFLGLLAFSAVLDFVSGLQMEAHPTRRKPWLAISLIGNLGLLGVFKYYDFFVSNLAVALARLGTPVSLPTLGLLLPVGISFYTFQTLSYTIDVYRGRLAARRNFLDYLTFILMFPHLVAGPVMKAKDLLPQLEVDRRFDGARVREGLTLALWGAAKKIMIADSVSLYVDRVFAMDNPPLILVALSSMGFGVQILADFSGYTDIARGTARMLGIELMLNFNHPFLAANPGDFWRRWHISFSRWIHEYVYEPLRGGATDERRRTLATFGSLGISGLWHGANWSYVVWGMYHAVLITGYRYVTPQIPASWKDRRWSHPLAVGIMFGFLQVHWLLFRETQLSRTWHYLTTWPELSDPTLWAVAALLAGVYLWAAVPMVLVLLAERHVYPRIPDRWLLPAQAGAWALCLVAIGVFARDTRADFIYFSF